MLEGWIEPIQYLNSSYERDTVQDGRHATRERHAVEAVHKLGNATTSSLEGNLATFSGGKK